MHFIKVYWGGPGGISDLPVHFINIFNNTYLMMIDPPGTCNDPSFPCCTVTHGHRPCFIQCLGRNRLSWKQYIITIIHSSPKETLISIFFWWPRMRVSDPVQVHLARSSLTYPSPPPRKRKATSETLCFFWGRVYSRNKNKKWVTSK